MTCTKNLETVIISTIIFISILIMANNMPILQDTSEFERSEGERWSVMVCVIDEVVEKTKTAVATPRLPGLR